MQTRQLALVLGVGFEGALGILALVLGWLFGVAPLGTFAWSMRDVGLGVLAALPLFVLFILLAHATWTPLRRIRDILQEYLVPLFRTCTWLDVLLVCITAGLGEELLFRGFLQTLLADWLGILIGLLLASVAFGFAHIVTLTYGIAAGLIGVYLGWLWLESGNLLVPIVAHAFYDFLALMYLLKIIGPFEGPPPEDRPFSPDEMNGGHSPPYGVRTGPHIIADSQ